MTLRLLSGNEAICSMDEEVRQPVAVATDPRDGWIAVGGEQGLLVTLPGADARSR